MKTLDFTTGKITKPLLLFAGPVLVALFLQALYGAVDLMVVGQFASSEDVSGVAIGSQLMTTLTHLIIGLSMGATIYLGQTIGEGKKEKSSHVIGTTIVLFLILGGLLTLIVPMISSSLATLMNAPQQSFQMTRDYIFICGCGSLMIVAYNVIGAIFRGIGDSRTPLMTVLIASVINIVGDLLLVSYFHLGARGAALATVISQSISVIISLIILSKQQLPFTLERKHVRLESSNALQIIKYGAPIALQDFLVSISFLFILAVVNSLGVTASAGVGVAEKVCAFIMLVPSAFMQSMSAFVAQNKGAGKVDRAITGLKIAIGLSSVLGVIMFVLSFFSGEILCSLFTHDQVVMKAGAEYLKAYGIDCLFTCFMFCLIGFFNGMGYTRFVMIQGVISAFLVRIPVAYLMNQIYGELFLIGLCIPVSTFTQIMMSLWYFRKIKTIEKI